MKTTLKILFLSGLVGIMAFSCGKEKQTEWSDFVEGYVVGSFQCQDTLENLHREYCIITVGNDTNQLFTFSIPDDLIQFPPGLIKPGYDENTGGPYFFPDSLKDSFKIRFKYKKAEPSEMVGCFIAFNMLGPTFPWNEWQDVICTEITRVLN